MKASNSNYDITLGLYFTSIEYAHNTDAIREQTNKILSTIFV